MASRTQVRVHCDFDNAEAVASVITKLEEMQSDISDGLDAVAHQAEGELACEHFGEQALAVIHRIGQLEEGSEEDEELLLLASRAADLYDGIVDTVDLIRNYELNY